MNEERKIVETCPQDALMSALQRATVAYGFTFAAMNGNWVFKQTSGDYAYIGNVSSAVDAVALLLELVTEHERPTE